MGKGANFSKEGENEEIDVAHNRIRLSAEGWIVLGPHPAYKMKIYPIVTMSALLQELTQSEGFGKQNSTIELPACPGDHITFSIVEAFCNGSPNVEDQFVSNAGKLIEVCDFLRIDTLSLTVLISLKEHVQSLDPCLNILATFDTNKNLQADKAFNVCQSSFINCILGPRGMSVSMENLYQLIQEVSPEMADLLLDALREECNKRSKGRSMKTLLISDWVDGWHISSLTSEVLWFRRLCSLVESADHNTILTEAPENFLQGFQWFRSSIFISAMQEKRIEKAKQTSKELIDLQKTLMASPTEQNVKIEVLEAEIRERDIRLKRAEEVIALQSEEKNCAVDKEKERFQCQICMTKPRDKLCLPSSHFLYCRECLSEHQKTRQTKTCPACRTVITGLIKCMI